MLQMSKDSQGSKRQINLANLRREGMMDNSVKTAINQALTGLVKIIANPGLSKNISGHTWFRFYFLA